MPEICIPPAASESGIALRDGFCAGAVAEAVRVLAAGYAPELEFFTGPLPDHADGVGVETVKLPAPAEPYLGCWRAVVRLSGRSADPAFPDRFSELAAKFPAAAAASAGIRFARIDPAEAAEFASTLHHGIPKRTAILPLLCEIDLTGSAFTAPSAPEEAPDRAMWQNIRPAAVEAAAAAFFDADPGPLPEECAGKSVRIIRSAPAADFTWRDFTLELAVRMPGSVDFETAFGGLLAKLPAENVTANGICFCGIWPEKEARFEFESLLERPYGCARVELRARVRVAASQGSGTAPEPPDPNRSVAPFDPAALERALAARIAEALGLTMDRELCRGEFPPPGCGTAPAASVRLTGVASGNRSTGYRVLAQLQLRAPHRDELFRRLLAFDALFPRYDETLGAFAVRALLKRDFTLGWKEENGRNTITAGLSLELVL